MCEKVNYSKNRVKSSLAFMKRSLGDDNLHSYFCERCCAWHIGHITEKETKKRWQVVKPYRRQERNGRKLFEDVE
jgi:hypothetical protein